MSLECWVKHKLYFQVSDKPDKLTLQSGWLGGWAGKRRAMSESEGASSIKLDIISWLTGSQDKLSCGVNTEKLQERRPSSKDVEEAMAGGLSKVNSTFLCFD